MAKPHYQLLAESLARAKKRAVKGIIRTEMLARHDLERLEKDGWLTRIIRGWYLLKQPIAREGDSTLWYSSFWDFITIYLKSRFESHYCLSSNASIDLHIGRTTIPNQLLVMTQKGGSSVIDLPFKTSIVIYQETKTFPKKVEQLHNVNIMPLSEALYRVAPTFFQQHPGDAEIALRLVDLMSLSRELLTGTNISSANRIIGAYYFLGEKQRAKRLQDDLIAAGYELAPSNPFTIKTPSLASPPRMKSPYAARISIMWQKMRTGVLSVFPDEPGLPRASKKYFSQLEKIYVNDAYNSLSIEGYEISADLITRIANGKWNPDQDDSDKQQINAMAAKGYRKAFESVKRSIDQILHKKNPGMVIKEDLHSWYSALFSPSVKAGILTPTQLAGYRIHQVYIRNSMHTPLPANALVDAMDTLFDCLINETHAAVRAILGHFIFVFIHPYMDGNGRIGRFIMNSLFASGGFPWTIVKVAHREQYIKALEKASVDQDIIPFAKFILGEIQQGQVYARYKT